MDSTAMFILFALFAGASALGLRVDTNDDTVAQAQAEASIDWDENIAFSCNGELCPLVASAPFKTDRDEAANAFDGNLGTSFKNLVTQNAYLGVNLETPRRIGAVSVTAGSGYAASSQPASKYIQGATLVASNSSSWNAADAVELRNVADGEVVSFIASADEQRVEVTPVTAQYIFFIQKGVCTTCSWDAYIAVAEMKIHAAPVHEAPWSATVLCNDYNHGNRDSSTANVWDPDTKTGMYGCADLSAQVSGSSGTKQLYHDRASGLRTIKFWDISQYSQYSGFFSEDGTGSGSCSAESRCTHMFRYDSGPGLNWRVGDVLYISADDAAQAQTAPTPAPASSGGSGSATATAAASAAKGDPHLMNLKGEAFDVMQTGNMMLLEIPRRSSPATLDLALHADIERLGVVSCGPTFITRTSITGRWTGVPLEIRSGPIAKEGRHQPKHAFAIRFDGKAWLPHAEMQRTMELSKDATITALDRMFLFQVRGLDIAVSQPKRPRIFLDIQVKGLGNLKTEIGGLLGIDDHSSVEELPSECEVSASSLSLVATRNDEALQWSARALL